MDACRKSFPRKNFTPYNKAHDTKRGRTIAIGGREHAGEKKFQETVKNAAEKAVNIAGRVASVAAEKSVDLAHGAGELADTTKKAVLQAVDKNGDGQIGIEDVIVLAMKVPGVHINREKYLRKELFKNHPDDVIEKAVATTPANAGIHQREIDRIADEAIKVERTYVSGISAALGAPGGLAMVATLPADLGQYYAYMLRAAQKLMYLYGFPELRSDEDGLVLDSETLNALVLCLGAMYGVAGAKNAINVMAHALSKGVEKKLVSMALTKGAIYPVVKSTMKWFGVSLTKKVFANAVGKTIPVVGGLVGGGITFFSFKPCCDRLKVVLQDTMLSNPEHKSSNEETDIFNEVISGKIVEVEPIEVVDEQEVTDVQETE